MKHKIIIGSLIGLSIYLSLPILVGPTVAICIGWYLIPNELIQAILIPILLAAIISLPIITAELLGQWFNYLFEKYKTS